MNDRYAAQTSSAIRRTFDSKRKRDEFIGAFAPYGYLKDENNKNHLVVDEEIAQLKREILSWVVRDGMSWKGIAKRLNEMGVPSPTLYKQKTGLRYKNPSNDQCDGLWCGLSVKRVMLDPVNLGHMIQGKSRVISYKVHDREAVPESEWFVVKNTHQPTFSQEEYDTMISVTKRDTRTADGKRDLHLLSGFLRCADCGASLHRRQAKKNVYYHCRTYREKSKTAYTKHTIREDVIGHALLAAIQKQIQLLISLADLVDGMKENAVVNTKSQRISKMLEEKRNELTKVTMIADGLYADWKTGEITKDDYVRMRAKYGERISSLEEAMKILETEQSQMDTAITGENALFKTFLKYRSIEALDRGILSELIDVVLVHENREITIKFRYDDELARINELIEQNRAGQD